MFPWCKQRCFQLESNLDRIEMENLKNQALHANQLESNLDRIEIHIRGAPDAPVPVRIEPW